MKFTTDKIKWTEAMESFATRVITEKLSKIANDYDDATVKLSKLKHNQIKVALSIDAFRAQVVGEDFYAVMSEVTNKLKRIIAEYKKRYHTDTVKTKYATEPNKDVVLFEDLISKEKVFELTPILIVDALKEFEQTDYPFYAFRDAADDNQICIIYRRFGDTYGIIRCH